MLKKNSVSTLKKKSAILVSGDLLPEKLTSIILVVEFVKNDRESPCQPSLSMCCLGHDTFRNN